MTIPQIQWYPGHIAKAERKLYQNIEKVDLVIEVRDARIPLSTSHPYLNKWIKGKKHLLVINRKDMISSRAQQIWDKWFRERGESPWWCNAKSGIGVKQLLNAAIQTGFELNTRRAKRGMKSRAVRALTLGYPNVGKSALINRLLQKKVVDSARKAGVTRSLQWVRIGKAIDLLDAPGVLPPRLDNQKAALKLAFCDDIGQGSYDTELIAVSLLKLLNKLSIISDSGVNITSIEKRYGVNLNPQSINIENWLIEASKIHTSSDTNRMAQRILDDFRKVLLGKISLELP